MSTAHPELALANLSDAQQAISGRLGFAFDEAAIAMAFLSPEGAYLSANEAYCRLIGRSVEELRQATLEELTHPEDLHQDRAAIAAMLAGEAQSFSAEKRYLRPDSSVIWGLLTTRLVRDDLGGPLGFLSQIVDISQRKEAEAALRETEERLRLLAEDADDLVVYRVLFAPKLKVEFVSSGVEKISSYPPATFYEEPELLFKLVHPDDVGSLFAAMNDPDLMGRPKVVRWVHPDGKVVWTSSRGKPIFGPSGEIVGVDGIAYDVTDRMLAEQALEWRASHDPLTGLPNGSEFRESLAADLAHKGQTAAPLAVCIIGLEHFAATVDAFGEEYGERLIVEAAKRLSRSLQCDCLARTDTAAFALALTPASEQVVFDVVERILGCFDSPFTVQGQPFRLDASVGIALAPLHGEEPELLVRRAARAQRKAQLRGLGHTVYSPEIDETTTEHLSLLGELREALEAGQMELYYQPKMRLADSAIYGVEALLRWHHPRLGPVPPNKFIPLAERSGLVKPLTAWVLETAARQVALWRADAFELTVAVNVTPRILEEPSFAGQVEDVLGRWGLAPSMLTLEMTERAVMTDPGGVHETCRRLSELGVCISLDDFGTGQSALSTVTMVPVGEIKVDMSFVQDAVTQPESRAIVNVLVNLARSLGLHCVAEGVEDADTEGLLEEIGCEAMQGYFLARPLPAHDLADWLTERLTLGNASRRKALLRSLAPLG